MTTWKWSEEEKKVLSEMAVILVMFVGEKEAGKSSLVNSIMRGEQCKMDADDRTVVADLLHWFPDGKDKTLFNIIDCGGHESYHITGHYFHRNNPNNVAVLCHDISRDKPDDYKKTLEWLKSVITRSPKCQILIILTQKDKVKDEREKTEQFIKYVLNFLQKEMDMLNLQLQTAKTVNSNNIETIEFVKNKYSLIKDNIRKNLLLASCQEGQSESVKEVKISLLKMADDCKIIMPKTAQELFTLIGKTAAKSNRFKLRSPEIQKPSGAHVTSNVETTSDRNMSRNVGVFETFRNAVARVFKKGKGHNRTVDRAYSYSHKDAPYLYLDEIIPTYKSILYKLRLPSDNIRERLKNTLQFHHHQGFLMNFRSDNELDNIIFHDMTVLLEIMKTLFHHNRTNIFKIEDTDPQKHRELLCKLYGNNEKKYKDDNKRYQEGLLSHELLSYHLEIRNIGIDAKIVMHLLTCIEAGFTCQPEKSNNDYIFIPFLIEQKTFQSSKEILKEVMLTTDAGLSLSCQLLGNFPITFWSYLVVATIVKLKIQRQTNEIWQNGFYATVGQKNTALYIQYTNPEQIDFYIKAKCDDKVGHELLWKYIRVFNNECRRLVAEWWPGLITKKVLKCPECHMKNTMQEMNKQKVPILSSDSKSSTTSPAVAEFDLEDILQDEDEAEETCCCDNGCKLPAALIKPLPKGLSLASNVFFYILLLISLSIFRKKSSC